MILGIGSDFLEVARVEPLLRQFPVRFPRRILHADELAVFARCAEEKRVRFLAKKFAIKEAASKALGTGMRDGVAFNDFVESRSAHNQPQLRVCGKAAELAAATAPGSRWHVTLTDEGAYVLAFVIWEAAV